MILYVYGEIMKIVTFYQFDIIPRFHPFLLHVRCKFGVTFVWICFRDVKGVGKHAYIFERKRNVKS